MRPTCKIGILVFAAAFLLTSQSAGQSLGDVARANRQAEQAKGTKAKPKVITNENLPSHTDDSSANPQEATKDIPPAATQSGDSAVDKEARGEELKTAIRSQKEAIARAQAQLDKFNASIHYVVANEYTNGVQYNQYQAKKQEEAQRYQEQLNEAKQKLQDMQESARREGFGSAVYDP